MTDVTQRNIALHLFSTRDPPVGGVNVWTTQFLKHAGAQHIHASFGLIGPSKASDSVQFVPRVKRLGRGFLGPLLQVWLGHARQADVVHLCVSGGLSFWRGLALAVLTWPSGRPFVVHLHSRTSTCARAALRLAERLAQLRRVAFVTPNEADARRHPYFRLVENFVPDSVPANIWRGPGFSNGLRLAYVGAMLEDKGLFELVDAVAQTRENVHVDCFGPDANPADLRRLRERVGRLELAQRFRYCGVIAHQDLPDTLCDYDALVLPSRSESFSLAAAEAMQLGLPVMSTAVGFLTDAPEGSWIRLASAPEVWAETLDDVARRKWSLLPHVSRAACAFIEARFEVNRAMGAWRHLYEQLMAAR